MNTQNVSASSVYKLQALWPNSPSGSNQTWLLNFTMLPNGKQSVASVTILKFRCKNEVKPSKNVQTSVYIFSCI